MHHCCCMEVVDLHCQSETVVDTAWWIQHRLKQDCQSEQYWPLRHLHAVTVLVLAARTLSTQCCYSASNAATYNIFL